MLGLLRRRAPSGFSPSSTAEEVTAGIDGCGLVAIVTGASHGIGTETCRVLALRGVQVVMGVRNTLSGARVREEIVRQIPTAKIEVLELDLSSMSSVRRFVKNFNALNLPLNILINNAGIAFVPFELSEDGIELHFATNHLGHFLLTDLLLEKIKVTAEQSDIEGRIVIVSSQGYKHAYREGIRFHKINDESGYFLLNQPHHFKVMFFTFILSYSRFSAYGQSKLANILHSNELSKNLKGAATVCYLALHPQVAGVTGKYFIDCNATDPKSPATDKELVKRLWDFSASLVH
ncbi:short-chain dehydrogenase TIC 32, chloroplastic [Setaria viridis]|uniref:short-chain dehydrogenase TIC 32, chloroplastic n=1 Tax=Setaria viridis TaxID=4556 RepID=UPI003B3BA081